MFQEIINNLKLLGAAFLIFTCAYGANMAFSIWYNIKGLNHSFDEIKIRDSILKLGVFAVGLTLLSISITALPIFADTIGWPILEEYANLFTNIIMVTVFLTVTCKYIKEAFDKFKLIVSAGELPNSNTEAKHD